MMDMLLLAAGAWLATVAVLFGIFQRHALGRLWREPVLRDPVLIIESDDWGPGPASDAQILEQLATMLARHRDAHGHPAVMTLGMLLAVADTDRIREAGGREYFAARLSEARFSAILSAIRRGMASGVFSPQLHGMEHYWPAALMKAAGQQPAVHDWLVQDSIPRHEDLPPQLQSRWIDGSQLPSQPLAAGEIARCAKGEARAFQDVFGIRPAVAVPPTFLWTELTEASWAAAGVRVVVTPGRRYFARNAEGGLVAAGGRLHNGERGTGGVMYLVRDDYFEPALGHRAEGILAALERKAALGRPVLVETHRFNFTGSLAQKDESLSETARLLQAAVQRFSRLRFMSTTELADSIARQDPELIDQRLAARIKAWLAKAAGVPELRKLAWVSGAIVPAWAVYRAFGWTSQSSARAA